ncbi:hypothetical protein EDI_323240 [Entamoeba dispar SAW760]|uniref:Uncharacterized protein n=1 Tax=Entamoeba dispar (strain ATCC PRA-260 / SAW760) TaxID=370354 RepID=B0EPK4_ENTDS|nr:uncharacterized protein EDI_323240 [Entamoeba dispar SAW760]EDR23541.1 hypothetical protein EDI_323240 [Entamoeba dispar SAW760]|eukprot:EDR23541.1 hypothetical protein EDI_323240 [Entamoeba dispar SAW760]
MEEFFREFHLRVQPFGKTNSLSELKRERKFAELMLLSERRYQLGCRVTRNNQIEVNGYNSLKQAQILIYLNQTIKRIEVQKGSFLFLFNPEVRGVIQVCLVEPTSQIVLVGLTNFNEKYQTEISQINVFDTSIQISFSPRMFEECCCGVFERKENDSLHFIKSMKILPNVKKFQMTFNQPLKKGSYFIRIFVKQPNTPLNPNTISFETPFVLQQYFAK